MSKLQSHLRLGRRALLGSGAAGLGSLALASLLGPRSVAGAARGTDFPAKAKRAIWLFMAGGPSQLDLFDYKPQLAAYFNQELPESVRAGQRLSTMTSTLSSYPIAPSRYKFAQYGQAGTWVSELLPYTARLVDDIAVVNTVSGTAVNHDPAVLELLTGATVAGKPSVGAWLSYGLGALNQNLPTFVVLTSSFANHASVQALSSRLWGSAFLPSVNGGVAVRAVGDPVLFLKDPAGVDREARSQVLELTNALNQHELGRIADPDISSRIDQAELAFRMQGAVPELTYLSGETAATKALYGPSVDVPGSFANNCLLARRMLQKDVRFVQLFHRGWDAHYDLPIQLPAQTQDVDQACFGLVSDLKQLGLLEDTLVIWGGEFGRTVFAQGDLTTENFGRDHHPNCFTIWMAGAGIKPGIVHGKTDDFGYNIVEGAVPLRDLHATLLHQFGIDHDRLVVPYQGLQQKLVGVDAEAHVVSEILA